VFLVNPNGTTDPRALETAENGAIIEGMEQDVSTLGLNKYNDYRVALETITTINERLSYAFLLNSAVQRNGDRVTAEEIRYQRNALLSASDWTQVADAPVDQTAWAVYRQALRDIPDQEGFPASVEWPVAPS